MRCDAGLFMRADPVAVDKSYITHSEWERDFGGAKNRGSGTFRRLPFNCCALSLRPFETPVCAPDGSVFDLVCVLL